MENERGMRIAVFLLKRGTQFIAVALLVAFAAFWLSSAIPGDFFSTQALDASSDAQSIELLRQQYGLDQPFHMQYLRWLKSLLRLDLGRSIFYQRPVFPIVADALANTLWMGLPALFFGFGMGLITGTVHGVTEGRPLGRALDLVSSAILSAPSLLLGLAALLLASHTRWFPLGGMNSPGSSEMNLWQWFVDRVHHLVLPAACLTIPVLAYVERIQCAASRDVAHGPHIRSARVRGLGRMRIFFHYVMRPSLNPAISISGPMIGGVLSGSLVLEVIFSWPGLGQITYNALFNRDIFLLAGCVMGSSFLLIIGNLAADLALAILDPRTRPALERGLQ